MKTKPTYEDLEKELKILRETKDIVERSPAVAFLWKNQENWPVEFVSNNVNIIFGYSADEFITGKIVYSKLIHPDDLPRVAEEVKTNSKNTSISFTHEPYRIISKSGEIKWLNDITYIRRDKNGKITYYEGIILDITERKKAEQELLKKNQELLESEEEIRAVNEELIATTNALKESNEQLIITKETAEESFERYQLITQSTLDVIFIMNKLGKFLYVNKQVENMFGYKPEEFIDEYFTKFVPKKEIFKGFSILKNVFLNKEINNYNTYGIHKSGKQFDIEVNGKLIKYNGKLVGLGTLRDITDRKKTEQALKESEERLRELNATKDKFFSIIAHDLKSPFNTLLGLSEVLMEDFDEYDIQYQKKSINNIYQSAHNTFKLLENLLLWSCAQRGIMDFYPESENLYLISVETVEPLSQSATNKSISIKNKIPEDIFVKADKNMLLTVLRNLISNAIKFTPKGGEIFIKARQYDNNTEISVKDTGIGISVEEQLKLFQIEEGVSSVGTENEMGTGLGLILCKEFVEKHDGKIWVESKVGKGSKFIFTIPLSN